MTATADALMAIFGFKRVEGIQMKTDRELLELAARAAGYQYMPANGCIVVDGIPGTWNPLTDDGDALRLAVKLKIDIHQRVAEPRVAAVAAMHSPKIESVPDESQRLSATRAVIVRAAAAIGEQMP